MKSPSPLRLAPLADLCDRLSTRLDAGIALPAAWKQEAARARGPAEGVYGRIAADLGRGESLEAALERTGNFFPLLFRAMLAVGEQTGHLPEVLADLHRQYKEQLTARRAFQVAVWWPTIQLAMAVVIVGFLIWIIGLITGGGSEPAVDPLGLGLIGGRGAAIYFSLVFGVLAGGWLAARLLRGSERVRRALQPVFLRVPPAGGFLRAAMLSRFCRALGMALSAGISPARGLALAVRASGDARLARSEPETLAEIARGSEIHAALSKHTRLPGELIQAIEVGEETGMLPESMLKQAERYSAQAVSRMNTLAVVAAFFCWAGVAALLVTVIFRLFFTFILGPYRDLNLL